MFETIEQRDLGQTYILSRKVSWVSENSLLVKLVQRLYTTLCLKKTTLMLHTITMTHMKRFW